MTEQCHATKPMLTTVRRCPNRAKYGEWCGVHAISVGGWELVPPGHRAALVTLQAEVNELRDVLRAIIETNSTKPLHEWAQKVRRRQR